MEDAGYQATFARESVDPALTSDHTLRHKVPVRRQDSIGCIEAGMNIIPGETLIRVFLDQKSDGKGRAFGFYGGEGIDIGAHAREEKEDDLRQFQDRSRLERIYGIERDQRSSDAKNQDGQKNRYEGNRGIGRFPPAPDNDVDEKPDAEESRAPQQNQH